MILDNFFNASTFLLAFNKNRRYNTRMKLKAIALCLTLCASNVAQAQVHVVEIEAVKPATVTEALPRAQTKLPPRVEIIIQEKPKVDAGAVLLAGGTIAAVILSILALNGSL